MNKLILKIVFTSKKSIALSIIYIDKNLLAIEDDFDHYYDHNENFYIYFFSTHHFDYNSCALKLPSLKNYTCGEVLKVSFDTENELKSWLRRLSKTLNTCNINYKKFKNDSNIKPLRLKFSNEFWIL